LTPRDYTELVQLYDLLHPRGFEVLAFPCNQFGGQEPHDEDTICKFVASYAVKFEMFEKTLVNGAHAHPVFRFLKSRLGGVLGSSIKWNFTKFLCDRNGIPVKRYGPPTAPMTLVKDIEELLGN
jgi:glutathione peroxidase